MSFLKKCWNGKEKLWIVFWIYGIAAGVIFRMLYSFIHTGHLTAKAIVVILPVHFAYSVWWLVAAWRCSKNSSHILWTILARLIVVLAALTTIYIAVNLFSPGAITVNGLDFIPINKHP